MCRRRACALGCKTENTHQARTNGQTFKLGRLHLQREGKFPKVNFSALPVLCNHCSDAPCVKACPVKPKAMFKTPDGSPCIMMNAVSAVAAARRPVPTAPWMWQGKGRVFGDQRQQWH